MAAINRSDAQLSGEGSDPVMVRAFSVTGGYFHMLGVAPARGREFTREDELPKRDRSVILSDRLWRTRFAADPHIIGRTVTVNALPYSVVGVMPAGARHPGNNFHAVADGDTVDLWYPVSFDGNPAERGSHYMDVIGRLKSGVSPAQADADLGAILEQMKKEHTGDGWRVYVTPLYQEMVGSTSRMLLVLLGAVGLLLLIACVNAANLLLARSSARVREVAVRSALGAGRGRIIRQLLTESLVIACAGAGLGTVLAYGGVRALVASLPAGFPRAGEIGLDSTVFAFTLATAVLTGLLFGLVPAIVASRTDLVESLREGGRGATGGGRQLRLRNVLVMSETALACVLLIAAGLMLHSFVNQLQADPGFRSQKVLTASISLPRAHYKSAEARVRFFNRLMTNVESLPGVDSAGGGSDLPWTGYDGNADGFRIEGRSQAYNDKTTARYHIATPGYFRALGIPLLEGRFMNAHDDMTVNPVMLINESMAQRYWPNESALGKRITFRGDPKPKDWIEVIGVIKDIKDKPDSTSIRPAFWMAHAQDPDSALWIAVRGSSESAHAPQIPLAV
jgi:predicted permease